MKNRAFRQTPLPNPPPWFRSYMGKPPGSLTSARGYARWYVGTVIQDCAWT